MNDTSNMKTDRLSVRLKPDLQRRFARVVTESKRTQASVLRECLDAGLVRLERQMRKAEVSA